MKKQLIKLALLLAPFFSQANIFQDGTVDLKIVEEQFGYNFLCDGAGISPNTVVFLEVNDLEAAAQKCFSTHNYDPSDTHDQSCTGGASITYYETIQGANYVDQRYLWECKSGAGGFSYFRVTAGFYGETDLKKCPPANNPNHTYYVDEDGDGDVDNCANPDQIDLVDDCNYSAMHNSMSDYLINVEVTEPTICAEMPNGSICRYEAVDVGIGSQVYQYSLEGDSCYNNSTPDITEIPNVALPTYNESMGDFQCIQDGGLLACSETPENVVDENGNAPDGCGNINGVYGCYSTDTDGDTLPDYLDPDIDGDGIRNEDDLDADGDGLDDIDRGNNGSSGGGDNGSGVSGSVTVEIDLEPVVSELKKINETNVETKTEPNLEQESFWQSDYENGFQGMFEGKVDEIKSTALFGFINKFKPNISGGSPANYNFCFNLGSMGNFGCHDLGLDARVIPAIKILILISAAFACRRIIFGG